MKKILCVIMLSMGMSISAQDTVTVVAVGEADLAKDAIAVITPKTDLLNAEEKKKITTLIKLIMDDFDFYRNIFKVTKSSISTAKGKIGFRYIINLKFSLMDNKIHLKTVLQDTELKKIKFEDEKVVWFNNIRSFGHELADDLYRSITGKASIFKTKIIFVSDRTSRKKDLRKELYIMDFDGMRKQRLTYQNSLVISPAISPDNSKVIFTLMESKWKKGSRGKIQKIKNLNLYEMNLKSKKLNLVSSRNGINSGAVYSKDGSSIYVTFSDFKNADIFKMNLKTKKKVRITKHFSDDVDPHINADESLITFLSGRAGKAMIYTADPKEIEKWVKRISYVGKFNAAPRFSPDGHEIVFSSWVDNKFDIYRIGSDGRNLVRLTKNFGSNEEAWYSPDGQFIVFSSQRVITRKKAVQDLYIMNREGEIIKKITTGYGKVFTPRWSN